MLKEASNETWTFEVCDNWHLDAPQQAKSKVAEEHAIKYDHLTAKIIDSGGPESNALVTVALAPNR